MLFNSHISAYARCLARKVCGVVRSTWGTSQGEDKLGARDKILNTKEAHRAHARQTFPHGKTSVKFFKQKFCLSLLLHFVTKFFLCEWVFY